MQKFSLCLRHYAGLCNVGNWIKIRIACNIKELNLRVERHDYQGNFVYGSLPEAILAAKSLNVLNLFGFNIELPAYDVGDTLPKLKKIDLVTLEPPHSVLQLVDIAAINLEDLWINNLYGSTNVVRITACKALKSLYLRGVDVTSNWLEELFYSLQNLVKFELIRCKNLKTMKIASDRLKQLRVVDCHNLISA
ncbi:hypothetical protein P3S68_013789 [Capsicum galapagoense]